MLSKESSEFIDKLHNLQTDDTAQGWFKTACYLASSGKLLEAEKAIKIALGIEENYPIAWAILAAILLSSGRETDAEKAGKKAIEQCKKLRMTWPKLRSLIMSGAIRRGPDWKTPRRVIIDAAPNNEWGNVLSVLIDTSGQSVDDIITLEGETKKEIEIAEDDTQDTELTDKTTPKTKEDLHTTSEAKTPPRKRSVAATISETHSSAKQRDTASARTWFKAAENHLRRKDYIAAEKAFRRGLEFDPLSSEGWLRLGSLLVLKQKYTEAEKILEEATKQGPGNEQAWYLYGSCLQKLLKWQDAIMPFKNAINIDDNKADYWMKLGLSEYNIGQYNNAAKSFLRTLRITPNHRDATFYLAHCMELKGNRNHAFNLYNQLLKSGENRPEILEKMAGAFDRLGAADKAREARRKAALARRRT